MNKPAHTPGPLKIETIYDPQTQSDVLTGYIVDASDRNMVAVPLGELRLSTNEIKANARRLVAAWNACEGISTEALEQGTVPELLEAVRDLLGMVEAAMTEDDPAACTQMEWAALDEYRDLIAKAEGRESS